MHISVDSTLRTALEAAPDDTTAWSTIGLAACKRLAGWQNPTFQVGLGVAIGAAAAEARRGCVSPYRMRARFIELLEEILNNPPAPIKL